MKTLNDDLKLDIDSQIDLTLFWQTAAQLPNRPNATRSTHAILRARYASNGHRARTFAQMAHELGVTKTRAAELVRRALQRMRAHKAQFVIGVPPAAAAIYPDATHAQQWRRACDALGLGYAINPETLAQAVKNGR